ncbi:MAG: FkbM family methyltransferase [Planctomycetota bacterium]|nr:FkbM family methyltransferase [Planctomycetota bacterium]
MSQGIYSSRLVTSDEDLQSFLEMVSPTGIRGKLIRVGGGEPGTDDGDGGYLIPDDLKDIEACFSPGVETNATFERELAERGIPSFLADYSVESPPIDNDLFQFEKKYLGIWNDDVHMRLEDWVNRNTADRDRDLLLQMDIEGAEFSVIIDTPIDIFKRFRIMVIEFHAMDLLFSGQVFSNINQVFEKLMKEFSVVHIHPNNSGTVLSCPTYEIPAVLEFTFYRNDRVESSEEELIFPHPLDIPNDSRKKDIPLPGCWVRTLPAK